MRSLSFLDSPLFNALTFTVLWALQIFITKLAFLDGAEIVPFSIQSAFVSLLVLTLYVLPTARREISSLPPRVLLMLLAANAIHFALGGFLSNAGTALTSAVNAGFLVQFSTVSTTFFAWMLLKEKLTLSKIITVVMIVVGSFLLLVTGSLTELRVGDLLILLACCSWSMGNVIIRGVLRSTPVRGDIVSFLRPVAGLPVMFLFIALSDHFPNEVRRVFDQDWTRVHSPLYVILSGISVAVLWLFLNRTLKIASASYLTMMSSLTPVIVVMLAVVFLGESLTITQIVGGLIIILSGSATQILRVASN